MSEAITAIFMSRNLEINSDASKNPYSRPIGEFKRKAYHLIREVLANGPNMIISIHRDLDIIHDGPSITANPFYWGLLAMDEDHEKFTKHQLGLFSRQMLYANRHDVPPCLLVGFLYQSGMASKISEHTALNAVELWENDELTIRYEIAD